MKRSSLLFSCSMALALALSAAGAAAALSPSFAFAQSPQSSPFVSTGIVPGCVDQNPAGGTECDWKSFLLLVNRFISFLLYLSATLATLSFSFAGFLYITSAGDPGKLEKAHEIFEKVLWGFIFAFTAWLIVESILKTVGLDSAYVLIQ